MNISGLSTVGVAREEYSGRVDALRRQLADRHMDGCILLHPSNVYYITGFRHYVPIRPLGVIVSARDASITVITPKIEYEYAAKTSWISDVRYYVEFPEADRRANAFDLIQDVASEMGFSRQRIGIERSSLSGAQLDALGERLPKASWADVSPVMRDMRIVKSASEVKLLQIAGEVAAAEWSRALELAKPGVPEYEIALEARDAGIRVGAKYYSETEDSYLSPIINGTQIMIASERSSIPHGRASMRRLKKGDLVMMCFCLVNSFKGYRVGFTRHFSLGRPSHEAREVFDAVLEAQEAALAEVRPGTAANTVDEIARASLEKHDMVKHLTHRTGRGVGIDVAEAPEIKNTDKTILQPGMTFSVEPAVYIPGRVGIQIEDSIVVTDNGFESLTPVPKDLAIL